jgi:tRNA nucleotidyltransferase (CCA-adding enzyme)
VKRRKMLGIIPNNILDAIKVLNDNGFEAYLVGGAIRDILMGKEPQDFDICTAATPEEIKKIFPKNFDLGEKFGTVATIINDEVVEITTFRKDSTYSDGRHPDSVEFSSSIVEDLERRDFTMNAIAYSPNTGMVDPFGGLSAIENKEIKAVGNPLDRFNEDGLRIMRAVRFSSKLGFDIDKDTHSAMLECKNNLKRVSKERISSELLKILEGKNVVNAMMSNSEIIELIIPEYKMVLECPQNNPYHVYSLEEHTLKVVEAVNSDKVLLLSAFFHDFGKATTRIRDEKSIDRFPKHAQESEKITKEIMKGLKFDNKTIKEVALLIRYHDSLWNPQKSTVNLPPLTPYVVEVGASAS